MTLVTYTVDQHIATVVLNRQEAANALSIDLLHEYIETLHKIEQDLTIRVVLITGAGEHVFCAGADLKERKKMPESQVMETVSLIGEAVDITARLKQPTIAVLNGSAFGGGLELALACDLRVANAFAQVGLTETSLGIIPGAGGTQRLPRLIGIGLAKELIYTARRISADEAHRIGLVEHVFAKELVHEKAMELAKEIAGNAPLSLRQAKRALQQGMQVPIEKGLVIEREAYEKLLHTEDRKEGLRAFEEKRKPNYEGK